MATEDLSEPLLEEGSPAVREKSHVSVWDEVKIIFYLGIGFFVGQLSWVAIKITDTALIGHTGTINLEAVSLSDLYTSTSGSFLFSGVLSTFVSQANGAGNQKLGGIWFNVSLVAIGCICILIMLLWFITEDILLLFGVDRKLAAKAGYYAQVLMLCLPARVFTIQIGRFFGANNAPFPIFAIMVFCGIVNLVCGLFFVLGFPFKGFNGFGFKACPWVTTITEYGGVLFCLIVFCYWQDLHRKFGWESFDLKEITRNRIWQFLKLYFPQSLSTSSDFWRVAAIGAFAATISELDVAVFNTGYRVLWIGLAFVGTIGNASGIRLATFLGEGSKHMALRSVCLGVFIAVSTGVILSAVVFFVVEDLVMLFSSDAEVIARFKEVRFPLVVMMFLMNMAVFLEKQIVSTGRTKEVLVVGVLGSWLGQVPLSFVFINFVSKSLSSLYWGVCLGYLMTCVGLLYVLLSTDWEQMIAEAKKRSEAKVN